MLHRRPCAEPGCPATVLAAGPCREDDVDYCQDHEGLPACAWCGRREPRGLVEVPVGPGYAPDWMHPACARLDAETRVSLATARGVAAALDTIVAAFGRPTPDRPDTEDAHDRRDPDRH